MNEQEFRLLDRIEDDHWWFVGKRLLLRALLESGPPARRLADLGCGTGGLLRDWADSVECVGMGHSSKRRIRHGYCLLARTPQWAAAAGPGASARPRRAS